MNLNEVFKKIEMALTPSEEAAPVEEVKVEMANMRLANGVVIEAESFEAGQNVFLVGEDDEKVAAPVGEHELEDGRVLVIVEEGVIAEIKEVEEAPAEEEVEVEQAAEEEEMSYVTKEEFESAVSEIKEMIANMMPQEEEMSATEEVVEEQVEMSVDEAPAAKKVAVAPVEKKVDMNRYAKKAPQDTLSRVLSKLS
jgi:hypothetical protein